MFHALTEQPLSKYLPIQGSAFLCKDNPSAYESVVHLAGEEKQRFSLSLIRKGKEISVEVSPIEKSKLRSNNVIRLGGDLNIPPPLNIPDNNFRKLEEDMRKRMLENIQRFEQAAEQFNNLNQGFEFQDKK